MNAILFTVSPARTKTHTECSSLRATIVELCKKCVKVYFAYRKLRLCLRLLWTRTLCWWPSIVRMRNGCSNGVKRHLATKTSKSRSSYGLGVLQSELLKCVTHPNFRRPNGMAFAPRLRSTTPASYTCASGGPIWLSLSRPPRWRHQATCWTFTVAITIEASTTRFKKLKGLV